MTTTAATTISNLTQAQIDAIEKQVAKQAAAVTAVEAEKAAAYPKQRIILGRAFRDGHGTVLVCRCQECGIEHNVYSSDVHQKNYCSACKPVVDRRAKKAMAEAKKAFAGMSAEQIKAAILSAKNPGQF